MREAKKEELDLIADFIIEQMAEDNEFKLFEKNLGKERAKMFFAIFVRSEMKHFYKHGKVLVYEDLKGAIAGIDMKKMGLAHNIYQAIINNKRLIKEFDKTELELIQASVKILNQVHQINWYKKFSKNAYSLQQIAIVKEERGKGICRIIMEDFFKRVNQDIILVTFSETNVAIYEHFGFKLMETNTVEELTEYRMMRELKENN